MLTIYRRHRKECEHRNEGRKYRRRHCSIWVDGLLAGREIRKSLDTADWQKALAVVREMEAMESEPKVTDEPVTIEQGWDKFLEDAKARKLTEPSIYKYELLSRQMKSFAEKCGYRFLAEFTVHNLSTFRANWKDGALSSVKKLERLRIFLRFALDRKWITENPALKLKAPKVQLRLTLPFIHQEMVNIPTVIDAYAAATAHNGRSNAHRMRSLVLLLRYSGMRIGDAISITPDRVWETLDCCPDVGHVAQTNFQ